MEPVKSLNGVPQNMRSCHTALIDGYVIEGHVPAGDIIKLLTEKPEVTGLSVPEMPVGTPGMESPGNRRKDPFSVYSFSPSEEIKVFSYYNKY